MHTTPFVPYACALSLRPACKTLLLTPGYFGHKHLCSFSCELMLHLHHAVRLLPAQRKTQSRFDASQCLFRPYVPPPPPPPPLSPPAPPPAMPPALPPATSPAVSPVIAPSTAPAPVPAPGQALGPTPGPLTAPAPAPLAASATAQAPGPATSLVTKPPVSGVPAPAPGSPPVRCPPVKSTLTAGHSQQCRSAWKMHVKVHKTHTFP